MKYTRRSRKNSVPTFVRRATQVLYDKMLFYDQKGKTLLKKMVDSLESSSDDKKRAELSIYCYKEMRKCDDLAIECATKLAPYQTPKLVSVESKTKAEHRFVIRAPRAPSSKEDWMKGAGAAMLEKEIDDTIAKVVRERTKVGEETTLRIVTEDEREYLDDDLDRRLN